MAMSIDEFCNNLTLEEQRAMLRHPQWKTRCKCKRYGFPWAQVKHLLDDGASRSGFFRHTRTLCAPNDEFTDEARDILDQ